VARAAALLHAASTGEGFDEVEQDNANNPLESCAWNLEVSLTELLDAVEEEAGDLSIEDQDLVLEYLFDVDDALYDLDVRAGVIVGREIIDVESRDRLITIIDDLNSDP